MKGLAAALILASAVLTQGAEKVEPAPTQPLSLQQLRGMDRDCGFYLLVFNGKSVDRVPLNQWRRERSLWQVSSSKMGQCSFEFEIREFPKHLSITLRKANGDFSDRLIGLQFNCRTTHPCQVVPIDYMAVDRSSRDQLSLNWPYLWNKNPADPLGGFAIAWSGTAPENDAALAEVWAHEALPHPDIGRPWTESEVRKWIDDYYQKFAGLSETTLSAATPEELYYLTKRMKEAGIRRIYLHTDTWREEYWPNRRSFTDVNLNVFPGGRADLKKYSDYVHNSGMLLRLHNVSGGIGRQDPEFVRQGNVDPRLESWFHGTLEKPVTASAKEMIVRPDPGISIPALRLRYDYWRLNDFVVGKEIMRVGGILDSDGTLWTLKLQMRGKDGSVAAMHGVGARVDGYFSAYGQNYVPDPRTDLPAILAGRYADLINEIQLDHQHYDGAEIHRSDQAWGFDKFSYLVAKGVRHPTTTSTSGGVPTVWNLERRFSKIKQLKELGYWPVALPVLLDGHRNASSWLDAHYEASSKILNDGRRLGLQKPEPMFGVTREVLETHGLVPDLIGLVHNWKKVIFRLTEGDIAYIKQFLHPTTSILKQGGNHHQSRDVLVLEEREGRHYLVPTRILCREGVDAPWVTGQEFGPVAPRQYLYPRETVQLENPYEPQTPGLIVRVLPAFARPGEKAAVSAHPTEKAGNETAKARIDEYQTGVRGGDARKELPAVAQPGPDCFWPTQISPAGATHATLEKNRIVLTASNPSQQPYCEEETLPTWSCKVPLRARRAIEMVLEGDGSGAVLVVQLMGRGLRDYVVRIDFTGRKRMVIPNGEAAWANAAWGWRINAKDFDYSTTVSRVQIGFGYLPPKCRARVTVEQIALLENVPTALVDPVIELGTGELAVKGTIRSGEYLTYEAGTGVKVFDRNWRFLKSLPSQARTFVAGKTVSFCVQNKTSNPAPCLEVQVLTRGSPHEIGVSPAATVRE